MTVSTTTNRIPYTGDGVSVAFTVPFLFLANADIAVYINGVKQTTGFTTTGQGAGAGTVTFVTAPVNGALVVLVRDPDLLQSTALTSNGPFPADSVERMSDKAMIGLQRFIDIANRALVLNDGDAAATLTLPLLATRASKFLAFDASGLPIAAAGATGLPATAIGTALLAAVNAAAARGVLLSGVTGDALFLTATAAAARTVLASGATGDSLFTAATATAARAIINAGGSTDYTSQNLLGSPSFIRQTVLSGPVDSSGFAAFGGATGATTVTAAGTLVSTAAAAGKDNRTGSITNPAWTGLSTNGTMYLFLDIAADGTCTTGSTTLAPVYQWGGTYSVTNLQNTFNIQEMTMKVGNGTTAAQVFRVFVGEVTVAAAVVSAITWYALMGQYDSGFTATLPGTGTATSKSHNLGVYPESTAIVVENTTSEFNFSVGDRISSAGGLGTFNGTYGFPLAITATTKALTVSTGTGGSAFLTTNKTTGAAAGLTAANWKYKFTARRGW